MNLRRREGERGGRGREEEGGGERRRGREEEGGERGGRGREEREGERGEGGGKRRREGERGEGGARDRRYSKSTALQSLNLTASLSLKPYPSIQATPLTYQWSSCI